MEWIRDPSRNMESVQCLGLLCGGLAPPCDTYDPCFVEFCDKVCDDKTCFILIT